LIVDAGAGRPLKLVLDDTIKALERQAIVQALQQCDGSPAKAAKQLGISRASIYNKLKEYGLQAGSADTP
jgi:DNA-binding NtrC family response regulator